MRTSNSSGNLLAVELSLRRKQEFWETPRNIAILVGVTAAIAAAIGYWLGRASAPPPPIARPVGIGTYDPVTSSQFMDAVQTAGILVIAAMLVYVVVRLDRTLTGVAEKLQTALGTQHALQEGVERVWKRVEQIEQQSGGGALGDAIARAWERILKIEARLDAIEKGLPPPPGARPTDPPFGSI